MGLFGGGSKTTTSKTTRPGYITDFTNDLSGQIKNTDYGEYSDREYADLTSDQQAALQNLISGGGLSGLADQYTQSGQQGLTGMDNVYQQLQDFYNNSTISADQVNGLASQLYDEDGVNAAIKAQNDSTKDQLARSTLPQLAEQQNQAGFGSGARVMRDNAQQGALAQMQSDASSISNNAYQSALNSANSILSGNQQLQGSALSALSGNYSQMAGLGTQASNLYQQQLLNQYNAANQMQQNTQNQLDNNYQNAVNKQNYGWNQINSLTNAASVLNGAQGQQTSTTTSGGGGLGGILGGAMTGSIQGFMTTGNPYGALAGAGVGALGAAASQ